MSRNPIKSLTTGLIGGLLTLIAATGAQANTISQDFGSLGQQETSQSIHWDFVADGGWSILDFELAGYISLDGFDNGYSDIFHVSLNGSEVFAGAFNLGGGGSNTILFNPNGGLAQTTTFGATDDIHNSSQVTWAGGVAQISLPTYLLAGANQITFSYSGASQGVWDEAWGINLASLTATVAEPATYGLLFAGLLGLFASRRFARRHQN